MHKTLTIHLLALILFFTENVHAYQPQDTVKIPDRSLEGQYKELIQKSNNYNGYKIINPVRIAAFKKNYMDTLNVERRKLSGLQGKLTVQNETISSLKADLASKEQNLEKSKALVDEVRLLGISLSKSTYNILMWGLVAVLAAALSLIVFKSKRYRKEAKYRIKLFNELSEEFQSHKVKANEKEKKLARELQTEKNRLDELLGRPRY